MPAHAGGDIFRKARDGGRNDILALVRAWCKPVQLFSAFFACSHEEVIAAQPRLWRVVQHGLPDFPDAAQPEPWLYGQLAGEMELILASDATQVDALGARLAGQGARALRHDHLAVSTIGAGLARRVAALDARGHELLSRRYGGRPIAATSDAARRLLELRAALDWQADGPRPAGDSDPRFAQLLEDALGGGDPGARPRLHAALVGDPRLGPVFDRQARLDLVLGAWFAPAGPKQWEALIRELDWGGDDSSRLSPAVIQARRQAAVGILELAPRAPVQEPPRAAPDRAPASSQAIARRSRQAASRIAVLIAAGCILLGLLGALLLHFGRLSP
jgi:hypothetical protein